MATRVPRVMRWQARWALRGELGAKKAATVVALAATHYERPPARLMRTSAGRFNLEMAAYLLALRDALASEGYGADDASRLLARSLYAVMKPFYLPMELLAVTAHPRNRLARSRWRQRVSRRLFFRPPDWLMEDVSVPDAYAFDVRRCAVAEYMGSRGERRFCQDVFCAQDLLMAEHRGELLTRRRTIARGDDRCEFRFFVPSRRVAGA